MAKANRSARPENSFGAEDKEQKTPIYVLASCEDIGDYITIFEEFISIEDISVKNESSAGG